jgi:hypothetical protein
MKPTRTLRPVTKVRALQIAAAALAMAAGATFAADADLAFARAVEQIQAFPGRTAHGPGHSYKLRDVITDADGSQHVRVDRLYKGLRVIGGDMVVPSNRSGAFIDASRSLQQRFAIDTRARLGAAQALAAATRAHGGDAQGVAPELVVYARGESPALAYDVLLHGEQPDGTPSRLHVLVHAHSGALLDAWNEVETVSATDRVRSTAPVVDKTVSTPDSASPTFAMNGTGKTLFAGNIPLSTDRRFKQVGKYSMLDSSRGGQKTNDPVPTPTVCRRTAGIQASTASTCTTARASPTTSTSCSPTAPPTAARARPASPATPRRRPAPGRSPASAAPRPRRSGTAR